MEKEEIKSLYEYPTKFNKFKRMMQLRNTSSAVNTSNSQSNNKNDNTDCSDVTMTLAGTSPSTDNLANPNTKSSNPHPNGFNQLSISDHPPTSLQYSPSFHQQKSNTSNISFNQNSFDQSKSPPHPSTIPQTTSTTNASSIHSPPKKLFINRSSEVQDTPLNRSSEVQDTPLNLTTKMDLINTANDTNAYVNDDKERLNTASESPSDMDTSMSESMIIEDHFKRSLGSLYNNHTNHKSISSKPPKTTPELPRPYQKQPSIESPTTMHTSTTNQSPNSCISNNTLPTPNNNPFINPTMPTISPSVLINPFNFSLLASHPTSPLDAVVAAAQLFNNNNNNNSFFNSNANNFFNNNTNNFFNSFPPPVYNYNLNFNTNTNKSQQQSASQQQSSPSQQHQQQSSPSQQHQQQSPSHQHQQQSPSRQHQQISPKSQSLHHSSSFHGFKSPSSSSPSPFKSTRRQRYTPPDSYQPYPHPNPHSDSSSIHPSHPYSPPPPYEGDIKPKAPKSPRTDLLKRSNTSPTPQASVSGSVDDHFSKSLGDVWKQVQAIHGTHNGLSNSTSPNKHIRSGTTNSIHNNKNHTSEQQQQRRKQHHKQPSLPQENKYENKPSNNTDINKIQNYINEFAPELEDLIPTSVDDHFAKALGDKWLKIQADKPPSSPPSPQLSSVLQPTPLVIVPQTPSFFRTSPKSVVTSRTSGMIISPGRNGQSPASFYASPSSFVIRS